MIKLVKSIVAKIAALAGKLVDLVDRVFGVCINLLEKLLHEVSNIVELTFKVGIRIFAIYFLYQLFFEGLLEKIVDKL
jgi:hypothetical protein|tara:strand:- start:264 stop:497 length:234 start_codon:yes stop_codon:yes gene_type:complete